MFIMGFVGSPRKKWNSARMTESALSGAREAGAETEIVYLGSLQFKGCSACLACQQRGGEKHCHMQDELTPYLERAWQADGLALASPIYHFAESGLFRSFIERLIFPYYTDKTPAKTWRQKPLKSTLLYSMNLPKEEMLKNNLTPIIDNEPPFFWQDPDTPAQLFRVKKVPASQTQYLMNRTFGECRVISANDTIEVSDYTRYTMPRFDPAAKQKHHDEQFPLDLEEARTCGAWMAMPN